MSIPTSERFSEGAARIHACSIVLSVICLFPSPASAQNPAAPAEAPQELISIEGRVVNALTREPVRKANLTLMPSFAGGSTGAGPPESMAAVSDAEGNFKFENLQPGRYSLSAEKTGFVRQRYGSRAGQFGPGAILTIAPGQKIKDLEFNLTPQAVISGKVLDEDGEPLSQVSIQVLRQTAYSRRRTSMMGTSTNDVGELLIANLAPGKYILRAEYVRSNCARK